MEPHRPAREVARAHRLPVSFVKDTAAPAWPSWWPGAAAACSSFLYVFVDTFIGGGLVIDSHLRGGLTATRRGGLAGRWAGAPGDTRAAATAQRGLAAQPGAALRAGRARPCRAGRARLQAPWRAHTERWLAQAAPRSRWP
jgi:hypothetical protein